MPLNHVVLFQLKIRGDVTIEVSKAANKLSKSNKNRNRDTWDEGCSVELPREFFLQGDSFLCNWLRNLTKKSLLCSFCKWDTRAPRIQCMLPRFFFSYMHSSVYTFKSCFVDVAYDLKCCSWLKRLQIMNSPFRCQWYLDSRIMFLMRSGFQAVLNLEISQSGSYVPGVILNRVIWKMVWVMNSCCSWWSCWLVLLHRSQEV